MFKKISKILQRILFWRVQYASFVDLSLCNSVTETRRTANLIEFADEVDSDVEVNDLHVDGERHDNETRAEVDGGQDDDEHRGREAISSPTERRQYDHVAGHPEHAEHEQHYDHDVQFDVARSRRRAGRCRLRRTAFR